MEIYSQMHIENARLRQDAFWRGGPPPEYELHERVPTNTGWVYADKARSFVAALERTHSIRASKREADIDSYTFSMLIERSPWFCECINRVAAESLAETKMAALARATGYVQTDPATGKLATDADGRVIRKGSDLLAKYFFEAEERRAGIGVGVGAYLPLASDSALDAVRRREELVSCYPWTTQRQDGRWVLEVGKFNSAQMNRLSAMGVLLPAVPELWFVEAERVTPDRAEVKALRDRDFNLLESGLPALVSNTESHDADR